MVALQLVVVSAFASSVAAWGATGHQTVGYVAQQVLNLFIIILLILISSHNDVI
jgi:hypothetical protein